MPDPRVEKLAELLVHYSVNIEPGDRLLLQTAPLANPLNREILRQATRAGAHVLTLNQVAGAQEIFLNEASDEQLDYVDPVVKEIFGSFDAMLQIGAQENTRALSNVDVRRQQRRSAATAELSKTVMERVGRGDLRWCYTVFPTHAAAQEADMSLADYEEFVYGAGHLNEADPVQFWQSEAERQQRLIDWLAGKKEVVLQGSNIDMTLSIEGRAFKEAAGRQNFPDGEVFTSPVEDSAQGWVNFSFPAIYGGREVTNIKLWFEGGRVVREEAAKGEELLTALLDSDEGARTLGEWGIGTNYNIQRFTKHMLFDEKIGGTIHLAVGAGFPETGGTNSSGLHWDMLCDMSDSRITIDGELFYEDGHFIAVEMEN